MRRIQRCDTTLPIMNLGAHIGNNSLAIHYHKLLQREKKRISTGLYKLSIGLHALLYDIIKRIHSER